MERYCHTGPVCLHAAAATAAAALRPRRHTAREGMGWFGLVIALRPQTPKHIRGGWSHYTDTSEPVDGGVQL
jgi:hypothetical protein